MPPKRKSYSADYKLPVVKYAEEETVLHLLRELAELFRMKNSMDSVMWKEIQSKVNLLTANVLVGLAGLLC